ncbi:MAG: nucleotidyl transferase AbiEii/AbiGii toxin family protein [Bacteroidales bacterium]|nr:nucleotidyl transferase AbiEii/AbiGii toxin family protein [Bacteroidales bacterium]
MADNMILHKDSKSFQAAINIASDKLGILPEFIEKDYWITVILKRLFESNYNEDVVFKGGTSLSKGYRLIDRFSEDVDIAVLNVSEISGNKIKNLIRDVEKSISIDLTEIENHPMSSKGSRFRKAFYKYNRLGDSRLYQTISDNIIIEINSFANPFPYEKKEINSLIGISLAMNNQLDLLRKYELLPFKINVLDKRQTLNEKLVSLLRFSFEDNPVDGISGKIRHFYDLHFLLRDKDCKLYIESPEFKKRLDEIWQHDQLTFNEPENWKGKTVNESVLYSNTVEMWDKVKEVYKKELSALAFKTIPDNEEVLKSFLKIMSACV